MHEHCPMPALQQVLGAEGVSQTVLVLTGRRSARRVAYRRPTGVYAVDGAVKRLVKPRSRKMVSTRTGARRTSVAAARTLQLDVPRLT